MISKDEFVQWKNSPVTEEVFAQLTDRKMGLVSAVLEGRVETFDDYKGYIGAISAFNDMLSIDFEDVKHD